jgi:hypothetical protein
MEEFMRAHDNHLGPSGMAKAGAAVSWYCDLQNVPSVTRCPLAQRVLAGAKRLLVTAKPCERQPVTAEDLRLLVCKYVEGPKIAGRPLHSPDVMMVVAFVLMFAGFMRYDEAASILVHEECMVFGTDGGPGFVELFVPKSKTDQTWQGSVLRIEGTGGQLCPVGLLRVLLELGGYVRTAGPEEDCGPLLRATAADGSNGRHMLVQVTAPLSSPIPALSCRHVSTALQNLLASVGVQGDATLH